MASCCIFRSSAATRIVILSLLLTVLSSAGQRILRDPSDKDVLADLNNIVDRTDIEFLADARLDGRVPNSNGSFVAQEYLIDQLEAMGAVGLVPNRTGRDAFKYTYSSIGTNIMGILKGRELPDEYVVLSAHYDGQSFCDWEESSMDPGVCNSASDNAASLAIALGIGRIIAARPSPPRRSILFAFWDEEERGLIGSTEYANNPVFPLKQITTFLNFDIMGANVLPSLRNFHFALGAESGGCRLENLLEDAIRKEKSLDVRTLSAIFGQDRSDYVAFYARNVPFVFFSDSPGPCYHTDGDEIQNLDFKKVETEARIILRLAFKLLNTRRPPKFQEPCLIPAKYSDLCSINQVANLAVADIDLFPQETREDLEFYQSELNCLTRWGPVAFPFILAFDRDRIENALRGITDTLLTPECDGFQTIE